MREQRMACVFVLFNACAVQSLQENVVALFTHPVAIRFLVLVSLCRSFSMFVCLCTHTYVCEELLQPQLWAQESGRLDSDILLCCSSLLFCSGLHALCDVLLCVNMLVCDMVAFLGCTCTSATLSGSPSALLWNVCI